MKTKKLNLNDAIKKYCPNLKTVRDVYKTKKRIREFCKRTNSKKSDVVITLENFEYLTEKSEITEQERIEVMISLFA